MLTGLVAFGLSLAFAAPLQEDSVPRDARNRWIYDALDDLRRHKILGGEPTVCFGPNDPKRPINRYEAAVAISAAGARIHAIVTNLATANDATAGYPNSHPFDLAIQKEGFFNDGPTAIRNLKRGQMKIAGYLPHLVTHFAKELEALEVDMPHYRFTLAQDLALLSTLRPATSGEADTLFPDIAKNHWAAESLLAMRREGILRGLPDGRFGG